MTRPADIGNGIACASFAPDGSWLSVGTPDLDVGFVELSAIPSFDEAQRSHVAAVRQYRRLMTDARHAFLTVQGASVVDRTAVPGRATIEQRYEVAAAGAAPKVIVRFSGRLDRPAYAEITDVSPLPPLDLTRTLSASGRRLLITTNRPGLMAQVDVRAPGNPAGACWVITGETGAAIEFDLAAGCGPAEGTFVVACTIGGTGQLGGGSDAAVPAAGSAPPASPASPTSAWLSVPPRWRSDVAGIASGAVRYTLDCTALDVDDGETIILTDHRILPLSWTRDAYYQALAVLSTVPADHGPTTAVTRIGAHLRWLWMRCDRPGGVWQRSYQANGKVKDWAVQADQQLYPVLELLDHRDVAGDWPAAAGDWGERVRTLWSALPRDRRTGLLTSDENPADDDTTGRPLLLSTQILYWHTARRLADRADGLGLGDLGLAAAADGIRAAVLERFGADGPFGRQWAYAIDGEGGARLYHDSNDIPVALAPCFGFVSADDPVWDATMRFGFSAENAAFAAGPMGGLGSAHTPGVWPLGDIQEWVWASLAGDDRRVNVTLARLAAVANSDGLLPETYDPADGTWLSRPWFAWPGSIVAALVNGAIG